MNAKLNTTTQFTNDSDVFAYRGQAARLRSEAVKSAFKSLLARTRAQFSQPTPGNTETADCQAC